VRYHPFRHAYIGLGLLDESSIHCDGDTWTADYRIGAEPYLTVRIAPDQVEIEEFDRDGSHAASTRETTPVRAIGLHGGGALSGDFSRFWLRASLLAERVWVQLSCPDAGCSFVPAIGLGRLSVPSSLGVPWRVPAPGPIARRLGLEPFDEPDGTVRATLIRSYRGHPEPVADVIELHQTTIPGILLAETVDAVYTANGPLRAIEWRPFVENEPAGPVGRAWPSLPPPLRAGQPSLTGYAIVQHDEVESLEAA
jgi:hypothetical protein